MELEAKLSKLKRIIRKMDSVLVAFSGGADSTFLLGVASEVLPRNSLLAVTANSATYPKEELSFSKYIAKRLGVRHKIINTQELKNKKFISNPVNRCYFCKRELFLKLKEIARTNGLNFVADASNVSDRRDFRPGNQAKRELKIFSPLQEAGLNKKDISLLSKRLRLITWDKPALACLASRVPYGTRISPHLLRRIGNAEAYLRHLGFKQVRLRHYNGLCRIEVVKKDIPALIKKKDSVIKRLKRMGYNYISVDLEGYRTGSMNENIRPGSKDD